MLFFPDTYPLSLPVLKLLSPLSSHPLVHPLTAEFDFSLAEKSEDQQLLYDDTDTERESPFRCNGRVFVGRVLSYFKRSFKSGGLDQVSGIYQRDPVRFQVHASQDVAQSRATHALYDEDENGDPYAGDEAKAAMSLISEENTLRFARLDLRSNSGYSASIGGQKKAEDFSEADENEWSVTANMGDVERGIWDLMTQDAKTTN